MNILVYWSVIFFNLVIWHARSYISPLTDKTMYQYSKMVNRGVLTSNSYDGWDYRIREMYLWLMTLVTFGVVGWVCGWVAGYQEYYFKNITFHVHKTDWILNIKISHNTLNCL